MNDPLQQQPATEPVDEPARLEFVAGPEEAGDSACWAQFVCPDCGAVRSEGACRCTADKSKTDSRAVDLPGADRS